MTPGTACEFCGREVRVWSTDGRLRLCVPCERIPQPWRGRLADLLADLRRQGVLVFVRLEVAQEADDG